MRMLVPFLFVGVGLCLFVVTAGADGDPEATLDQATFETVGALRIDEVAQM